MSQQGDYGAATGTRTVTIPTSGTATLTVSTAGDDVDEPDGSLTATLATGAGYTVSFWSSSPWLLRQHILSIAFPSLTGTLTASAGAYRLLAGTFRPVACG